MKGVTFTAEGRLNTKHHRATDCNKQRSQAPTTYTTNTTKEELCFEYVNSFLGQFAALYPKRKLPYMMAANEYGVKKFVVTTIRPTQVPFQDLYDMYECASFLAGYILYEPLDPPLEPPAILMSPTRTLDSYTGDCFDISNVLCSFLIGAGYDAYVVHGYAPEFITLRDQSNLQCPIIGTAPSSSTSSTAGNHSSSQCDAGDDTENPYKPIDNSTKSSVFIAEQADLEHQVGRDDFRLWIPDVPESSSSSSNNEVKRVHAWVLVCSGKREVKEHLFIESSTGRVYPSSNSPYIGIESIWSSTNYYVNMQGFNGAKRVSEMHFDVTDSSKWECLFAPTGRATGNTETATQGTESLNNDAPEEGPEMLRNFDTPLTWANPLVMDRQRFLLKYPPTGRRTISYSKAKASFFARDVHPQAMTTRIVTYLDTACTIVEAIHEWFETRADKLYKRSRFLLNGNYCVEHYHPGSVGEVKTWTCYAAKLILVDFYVDGRLDRLYRREEYVGTKIVELYSQRDDYLSSRVVHITTSKSIAGARQFSLPGQGLAPDLFILKMVLKYDPAPHSPQPKVGFVVQKNQVAKRVFFIREGMLITTYHFSPGNITGNVNTFLHTKGPSIPALTEQALAQQLGLEEDPVLLQEAAALERESFAGVKMSVQAFAAIVAAQEEVEAQEFVPVERSVFDTALDALQRGGNKISSSTDKSMRNKTSDQSASMLASTASSVSQRASEEEKSSKVDYLAPFLRAVRDVHSISKEEALEIRQTCLDSYKARLVERANIIQARLNEENAKLGRKQEQFQRSQREGDMSTEEYEKYCTEAMFRIQILEQRLASHEETALKKFSELDIRLAGDARLKSLKSSER